MIRVIAGSAKGRKIKVPENLDVRPTTDRAREAVFNSLYSLGAPEKLRVLDLFAGSGAMGLESLSRGADFVTFVDNSKESIKAVHQNLKDLGFIEQSELVRFDALSYLTTEYPKRPSDLVFLDPPFAFQEWEAILGLLKESSILVIESNREIPTDQKIWEVAKSAKYSSTYIKVCIKK